MLIERISTLFKRISHAAMRAGRSPDEIELLAVTKTIDTEHIAEAIDAGLRIFGENRVQEGLEKIDHLRRYPGLEWHMIGTLQKNKVKKAVEAFDVIESVDSIELLDRICRHARDLNKVQRVYVQVKLSDETNKHGISPGEVMEMVEVGSGQDHVSVDGIMVIPPYSDDVEEVRPYFVRLREIRDDLISSGYDIKNLSMGMSNDFEVAVEEGSTLVRIGSAIFGARN